MDRTVLIEYADMKEEIKDLRRRIIAAEKEIECLEKTIVSESVACGKKGKKPIKMVKVKGVPTVDIGWKKTILKKKITRMQFLEMEYLEKQNQVEEFIEQIERSEIRMMFRMYYLDGMTWAKVAMKMNETFPNRPIAYTEDSCWRRNKRFFENVG